MSPGLGVPEQYDGGSENLRISFLEAVYGFKGAIFEPVHFLGYEFNVMAVSGAVCDFH